MSGDEKIPARYPDNNDHNPVNGLSGCCALEKLNPTQPARNGRVIIFSPGQNGTLRRNILSDPLIKKRALLIIDMQVGLFNGPDKPHDGLRVLANINCLIEKARHSQIPIFAARHTGPADSPFAPGTPLTQLVPELKIDNSHDKIFDKTRPSCFSGTGLGDWLHQKSIDELVIAGMKTEFCIDTTCRAAADLGFRPVLISDAHTTMDTPILPAPAIIAHHNRTLNGPFVKLISTDEYEFWHQ
ncbi:nicotinamidase-related amidase [Rahnella sp. BIGb0603]|nr:nicotinamidase-related amidase [Rahnella sp. BIGb0603]